MHKLMLFITFLAPVSGLADDWSPPENPDPSAIKREAKADIAKGNYSVALAKHLWFHENATTLKPSLSGVRLSFALSQWLELGEAYPPALEKLKEVRDATEKKIRDEKRVRVRFQDFHDFVALNKTLRQEKRTADTFKWLYESDPEDAKRVYGVSEAALIKQKEYAMCGEFLEPERDVERIGEGYASGLKSVKRFGNSYKNYLEKKIVNESATLVAILVKNGRGEEATAAATELRGFVSDSKLSKKLARALDAALGGTVPKPWP